MKYIKLIAVSLILGFSLVGCDTTTSTSNTNESNGSSTSTVDPVVAYLPYIQLASQVATGAVLQFAIEDSTKRTTLANQIYASAKALDALTTGKCPTVEELTATLNAYNVDKSITQYASYVSSIAAIYNTYYTKYVNGNGTYAAEVINALAKGAYAGASTYVTVTSE